MALSTAATNTTYMACHERSCLMQSHAMVANMDLCAAALQDHRHEMMKAIAHCRSLIPAEPAEPVLPQAVPAAAPAAGGDDDGEQLCKHLANLKLDNKPAELKVSCWQEWTCGMACMRNTCQCRWQAASGCL